MKNLHRTLIPTGSLLFLALLAVTTSRAWKHEAAPALASQASQLASPPSEEVDQATKQKVLANYGNLPMRFESNDGQFDEQVKFVTRGSGYTMFLTANEAVLALRSAAGKEHGVQSKVDSTKSTNDPQPAPTTYNKQEAGSTTVRMKLVNANANPAVRGIDELPGKTNYFRGNDPALWRTRVANYKKVHYEEVYPGIDLVYYGNQRRLEYDFVVAPGADPNRIEMQFDGLMADEGEAPIALDDDGNAVLRLTDGELVLHAPVVYQEKDGEREPVDSAYRLIGDRQLAFAVADYDATRPLVIDPILVYSTFLGGNSNDSGDGIAVDAGGNAYVTGQTHDGTIDFPTTAGAFDETHNGGWDVFVAKLSADGTSLVYSTFLGGNSDDIGRGIALDAGGNAYVTGNTFYGTINFPTTAGAYDETHNGGWDVFVAKLSADGSSLVYSTFLGGSSDDYGYGIALDASGNAYITGYTLDGTIDFPTTAGAFDETHNGLDDVFVAKLSADGSSLVYSTFLGGNNNDYGHGIAVDANGNAYVTGQTPSTDFPTTAGAFDETHNGFDDVFVSKLSADGSSLVYSTFLGGSFDDHGYGIALDAGGNAYVTGYTRDGTIDFPTTAGAFDETQNGFNDVFVSKLSADGSSLVYSTFLGGSSHEIGYGIAVDAGGNAYVTGYTNGADFPTTAGAFDETYNGTEDVFVAKLSADGSSLVYSTFLGGSSNDLGRGIAVDAGGNAYVTGRTRSAAFPTTAGAYDETHNGNVDVFVVKFLVDELIPVELSSFSARSDADGVHLTWTTATETENLGYHVYRAGAANGEYRQLTTELIPGAGTSAEAHDYHYTDTNVQPGAMYWYKIADIDFNGTFTFHGPIEVTVDAATSIGDGQGLPQTFALQQNYPNPFNPSTTISFALPQASEVSLAIYSLSGQLIKQLAAGQMGAGHHRVLWDGTDARGLRVASGVYLYVIRAGDYVAQKKLVLAK